MTTLKPLPMPDTRESYFVDTFSKKGYRTRVYEGHDYERAVLITNFWDERQDTTLNTIYAKAYSPIQLANWRFDHFIAALA